MGPFRTGEFLLFEAIQIVHGAVVLDVEAMLVTAVEFGAPGTVAQRAHGEHGAGGGIGVGVGVGLTAYFMSDAGGFDSPRAPETPLRDGHLVDERALGDGGGPVFGVEGVNQFGEGFARFAIDEDGAGQDAVFGGVAGRYALTDQ